MRQGKIELIVGFFTVIGLILLGVLFFFIRDIYFVQNEKTLNVLFTYVSILDKGAPVRLSGVRVGTVRKLMVSYEPKTQKPIITLTLSLGPSVVIREKTRVTVRGTTPLSEPHIEITNLGEADGPILPSNATVSGVDPIPIEQLLITANQILDQVRLFMDRLNVFFEDPAIARSVKGILLNSNALTEALQKIASGEQGNLQEGVKKLTQAADNLEVILQNIREGKGTAGKVLNNDELYNEILAFVKDLKAHPWKLLAKPKQDKKKGFLIF